MSIRKLFVAILLLGPALAAHAQVSRVFVSVNGNDANVCSNIGTPCRTLGGGITQVDAEGEVIVIDSGSYAGATITKSVKVNVASGAVAFSGLPIVVNPGSGTVVLRGLTIKAATPGSGTGIDHQSGSLFVENTIVDGWAEGLVVGTLATRLTVNGSTFRNQTLDGLLVAAGTSAKVAIDGSFFEKNGSKGVWFQGGIGLVSNSVITHNAVGAGVTNMGTQVAFQRCVVSTNDGTGVFAQTSSVLRMSGSTITFNGLTGLVNSGATVLSYVNNTFGGNFGDTSGTITNVGLQ
jgi:hypothetical protein